MSIFEILGEWISPGPTGHLGLRRDARDSPPTRIVVGRLALSVIGLTLLLGLLGIPNGAGATLACLGYIVLGTFLHPQPDLTNVGWLGGLVDHPFRFSDDLNRFLVFLAVVLWPGRIIGSGFLLLLRWLVAASRAGR